MAAARRLRIVAADLEAERESRAEAVEAARSEGRSEGRGEGRSEALAAMQSTLSAAHGAALEAARSEAAQLREERDEARAWLQRAAAEEQRKQLSGARAALCESVRAATAAQLRWGQR